VRITVDDGVELAVLDTGARVHPGSPVLVLVHGFGGGMVDFADHVDAFAATHRVVALDLRGHGASGAPTEADRYSLDRCAQDVLAVVDALQVGSFRLLGHSMGGMVARRVVARHPRRVEALVLMDTAPGPVPGLDRELVAVAARVATDEGMASLKVLLDYASPLDTPAYRRLLAERPDYAQIQQRRFEALSPVMWSVMALELCDQPDESAVFEELAMPTLVIVGELDEMFLEPSRRIAASTPKSRLVVLPNAGHSPQFETPAEWFDAVNGFLSGLDAVDR